MLSWIAQTAIAFAKSPRRHAVLQRRACFRGVVTGLLFSAGAAKAWHPAPLSTNEELP
jgi:hypothetical protein